MTNGLIKKRILIKNQNNTGLEGYTCTVQVCTEHFQPPTGHFDPIYYIREETI